MKKSDTPSNPAKPPNEEKLDFPVFTRSLPPPSRFLSMDEYLDFVEFCLECRPDRGKELRPQRKMLGCRFVLKD